MTESTPPDVARPPLPPPAPSVPIDDLDLLEDVDPADAPEIADRLAAGLAARLEAGSAEEEPGD